MGFVKAVREQCKLRMALTGISRSGKTYSSLGIAKGLGGKCAVIDSERSASKYGHLFDFDVCELENYKPETYCEHIRAAGRQGYETLIIDSLTHAWSAEGGVLDRVDQAATKLSGNKYAGWATGSALQNQLIRTILESPCHVIATMRVKAEYVVDEVKGKKGYRKVGLVPIQRDQIEYEFDLVLRLDEQHNAIVEGSRFVEFDGRRIALPGEDFGREIAEVISTGEPVPPKPMSADEIKKVEVGAKLVEIKLEKPVAEMSTDEVRDLCREIRERRERLNAKDGEAEEAPVVGQRTSPPSPPSLDSDKWKNPPSKTP